MADAVTARRWTGFGLMIFLLANAAFLAFVAAVILKKDKTFEVLSGDVSFLVRFLLLAVSVGFSWWFGRYCYTKLVESKVRADVHGLNIAYVMMGYLLLLLITVVYLGFVSWIVFAVLLLVLVVFSAIVLWGFLGPAWVLGSLMLAILACGLIFYLV
jgi:hypothetical protein